MQSNCSCPEFDEDVLNVVLKMIRGYREVSLAIAVAGLVIIVVIVAVISVFCDRKCHKRRWRLSFDDEAAVTAPKDTSTVANHGVESARREDTAAAVVRNSQPGPSAGTVCSTVSEPTEQPPGKDGGTPDNKSSSCGGCTEPGKCQPNQPTPKDPISIKETPKDPISLNETLKDPISLNETPKDPISLNETNGQDGATEVKQDLVADDRQSAVDIGSNRSDGEFKKANDLNDGVLTAIEDSFRQMAVDCLQDLKTDEDNMTRGQNGPPQFDMSEYKH